MASSHPPDLPARQPSSVALRLRRALRRQIDDEPSKPLPYVTLFGYISRPISVANSGLAPEIEDCPKLPLGDETTATQNSGRGGAAGASRVSATGRGQPKTSALSAPLDPADSIWARLFRSERPLLTISALFAFLNCVFFLASFLVLHSFLLSLECAPPEKAILFPVITAHCKPADTANPARLVGTPSSSFWMFFYAGAISLCVLLRNLSENWKNHVLLAVGRRARAATNSWVFGRVLYGNGGAPSEDKDEPEHDVVLDQSSSMYGGRDAGASKNQSRTLDVGAVLTLLSNDSQKWLDAAPTAHELWSCPLLLLATIIFIFMLMGWSALVVVVIQGGGSLPFMLICNKVEKPLFRFGEQHGCSFVPVSEQ